MPRIDFPKIAPELYRAMLALETQLNRSSLDKKLRELVKLRASQMNGCAFCIDMHWKDARAAGETEQRLFLLDAWRESPFYSEAERAALDLTEAITRVGETHVPDEVFAAARGVFSEKEVTELVWAIAAINLWNRIAIAFRSEPGHYQPQAHQNSGTD